MLSLHWGSSDHTMCIWGGGRGHRGSLGCTMYGWGGCHPTLGVPVGSVLCLDWGGGLTRCPPPLLERGGAAGAEHGGGEPAAAGQRLGGPV